MTSISYINRYFRAPSPLKPLKSSPRYQNLPGESLTAHSDHRGPLSDPIYLQKWCFVALCLPFWAFFDLFDFIEEALRPGAADLFHVACAAYNRCELKSTPVVTVGVK